METKTLYGKKGVREAFFAAIHPDINKDLAEKMYQEFLWKNPDFQSQLRPTVEDTVNMMTDFVNSYSRKNDEFCQLMTRQHRTLQQSFTRLVLQWLELVASEKYYTDGRNEASKKTAQKLLKGWKMLENDQTFDMQPSAWLPTI